MIALDTNVLVRFLVADDPAQTRRAKECIRRAIEVGTPCFVADIVLCELVWVLQRSYRVSKDQILDKMRRIVRSEHLVCTDKDLIFRALVEYEKNTGDFADYLIFEQAKEAGCQEMATFDRKLLRSPGFVKV